MVRKEGKSTVSIEDLRNSCLGYLNYVSYLTTNGSSRVVGFSVLIYGSCVIRRCFDLCFVSLGLVRVLVSNNVGSFPILLI